MRQRNTIASKYLTLSRKWRRLRKQQAGSQPSWEMVSLESAVRALGWVLGVDPQDGAGQPYGGENMGVDGKTPLSGVRLTGVWQEVRRFSGRRDTNRYWLLEVPASAEAGTQYWACFLTERQVGDLALAFGAALMGSEAESLNRMATVVEQADAPTVEEVRAFVARADWSARGATSEMGTGTETGGAA